MEEIIIKHLLKHGECSLPGIGTLEVKRIPATYDITNKLMNPPKELVSFSDGPGLKNNYIVEEISQKNGINKDAAKVILDKYLEEINEKLDSEQKVSFNSVGEFYKKNNKIEFKEVERNNFLQPIYAEKYHQEQPQHDVLIGENTYHSSELTESSKASLEKSKKQYWLYVSIILITIGLLIAIFTFYHYGFSSTSTGNQSLISAPEAPQTHN